MAGPAIWRPPNFKPARPQLATFARPGYGNLSGLLGGRRNPLLDRAGLDRIRGIGPQSDAKPSNPYAGILQDYLNQSRADFAAQSTAEKGDLINAIRKYVISYGASPNFEQLGGLGKDAQGYLKEALDQKTLDLARKAEEEGISSHARMSKANDITTRRIPAALAARGILRSGQTGSDLADQALSYKQQGYDMLTELMGGIQGGVSQFQNAERERQRQLAQMEMEMAMQAAQDWGDSYFDNGPAQGPARPNTGVSSAVRGGKPTGNPARYPGLRGGRKVLVTRNSPFRRK